MQHSTQPRLALVAPQVLLAPPAQRVRLVPTVPRGLKAAKVLLARKDPKVRSVPLALASYSREP